MPDRPGARLRQLREKRGLTLRDVQQRSERIAAELGNPEFRVYASRMSEIETHDMQPNIYRVYSLARVYQVRMREILSFYGIPQRG